MSRHYWIDWGRNPVSFGERSQGESKMGGDKTGSDRFYETYIPIGDRLYDEYILELEQEGLL
ncbi:hypothetical protein PJF56_12525 [Roseofilum sp. BLCC_M91]|uniref:Uncharacterized protein n=1 Tax=Roseofilum halophilum BLCC-M91 TaxID=3022259 RepID=A0ABT7BMB7_9CYAN|nr:hypothetical protein [Roseofilum halophilum]MDJ1179689.1 hypothetical protein [Roseofilum halophilum BLCC-M91]